MRIKLHCGREVVVSGFSFGYTYDGLFTGFPNEEINSRIFHYTSYPENWGKRRLLKIQPSTEEFEKRLKGAYYCAWLNSNTPVSSNKNGSELVVIWFAEVPEDRSVKEIVEKGIKYLSWNDYAEDFDY